MKRSELNPDSLLPEDQEPGVLYITQGIASDITSNEEYQLRSLDAEVGCYIITAMRQHKIKKAVVELEIEWPDEESILRYRVRIKRFNDDPG